MMLQQLSDCYVELLSKCDMESCGALITNLSLNPKLESAQPMTGSTHMLNGQANTMVS